MTTTDNAMNGKKAQASHFHQENNNKFLSELYQTLPKDRIYTDELRTLAWGTDAGFYRYIPRVVVRREGIGCHRENLPQAWRAAHLPCCRDIAFGAECQRLSAHRSRQTLGAMHFRGEWRGP